MRTQIEENRALVLKLMAALDVCDMPTIRELVAPEAQWWVLGMGSFDLETVLARLQAMLGSAKVAEITIIGTTAENDRVVVESSGNFEFEDGRAYRNSYMHLFTVEKGQVTSIREYLDLKVLESIFG
jgi:ketosteroid isomerase-like protein